MTGLPTSYKALDHGHAFPSTNFTSSPQGEKLNMTTSNRSSPMMEHCLPADFSQLEVHDRSNSSTPLPKPDNASRSLVTPPDFTRVYPIAADELMRHGNKDETVFVQTRPDDDVFGNSQSNSEKQEPYQSEDVEDTVARTPNAKHTPRADRMNDPITPLNAQGVLPPEACVFVANLSVQCTDDQLERSCHAAFDCFGPCVVKVRRDKHKHPFALVQYHKIEDAHRAIKGGRDIFVDGRKIRTEHAQARRSVVLSRVGGGPIRPDEAQSLLEKYGPIAQMYPTTHQDARLHGLPEGMWVQFAYYLDFKDAVKNFNNGTTMFRIHDPPAVEPRIRAGPGGSPVCQGFRTPRSTTDQKSIFVGNLPDDVTEDDLRQNFHLFGTIRTCNVIRKPLQGDMGFNTFGFIEFATIQEADSAADAEIDLNGQRIRVEPKEYSARRHTRLQENTPSQYSRGVPAYRQFGWPHTVGLPYYQPAQFFAMSPQHAFDHTQQRIVYNAYGQSGHPWTTPPASIGRVDQSLQMSYPGSPHTGQYWGQYAFPPPQYGGNGMAPIRENESEQNQF